MVGGLGVFYAQCPPSLAAHDLESPLVVAESDLLAKLGGLIFALAARRSRSLTWYHEGYAGCMAALLDPQLAPAAMSRMQEDWAAWTAMEQQCGAFWQKLTKRSTFQSPHTQMIFGMVRKSGWHMNDTIANCLVAQLQSINQTKMIEDVVRCERVGEVSKKRSSMGPLGHEQPRLREPSFHSHSMGACRAAKGPLARQHHQLVHRPPLRIAAGVQACLLDKAVCRVVLSIRQHSGVAT